MSQAVIGSPLNTAQACVLSFPFPIPCISGGDKPPDLVLISVLEHLGLNQSSKKLGFVKKFLNERIPLMWFLYF